MCVVITHTHTSSLSISPSVIVPLMNPESQLDSYVCLCVHTHTFMLWMHGKSFCVLCVLCLLCQAHINPSCLNTQVSSEVTVTGCHLCLWEETGVFSHSLCLFTAQGSAIREPTTPLSTTTPYMDKEK